MKSTLGAFAGAVLLVAAIVISPIAAAGTDYGPIADKLVNQSLAVQPGEVILINGGPTEIKLLEALQVEVAKAGGEPIILLNLPEANKRSVMETPIEHLERLNTGQLMILRAADGVINVGSIQDPELFADVPEERLAAARKANAPLNDAFANATFRSVSLGQTGGIPTEAYAKSQGADYKTMNEMFWRAVNVAPDDLAAAGDACAAALVPGTTVNLTTAAGTDLTFRIGSLPARINAGRTTEAIQPTGAASVWLPAGEAYVVVDESSVSGTVVVPWTTFRGMPIENLKMTYKDGKMTGLTADKNAKMVKDYFASASPNAAHVSVVDIGLNTASKPFADSHYHSWEMGGMVTLNLGNNGWAGGDNNADGAFTTHLAGATLSVGGQMVVQNGQISEEMLSAVVE